MSREVEQLIAEIESLKKRIAKLERPSTGYLIAAQTSVITGDGAGGAAALELSPTYDGGHTVTKHNYIYLQNPGSVNGAVITHAAVVRFDQAVGTHLATAANGVTGYNLVGYTPGGVSASSTGWMKVADTNSIYYIPLFQ